MAAPSILEILPTELIKEVIKALRHSEDQAAVDDFNNAMQTCRAMCMICSGFITKLEVYERRLEALATFPRHAVVKILELHLNSARKAELWLASTHAAARERLQYVEIVAVDVVNDALKVRR